MITHFKWPLEKKSATMVTIELDGEYLWIPLSEKVKTTPKSMSVGTYAWKRGAKRILASLEEHEIRATVFTPGAVAQNYPEIVRAFVEKGHEIALHGWEHENFGLLEETEQKIIIEKSIDEICKCTGKVPVGFRAPEGEMTPGTLGLLEEAGLLYDNSFHDNDIPYFVGEKGRFVEIPMRWELHDLVYFAFCWGPDYPIGESRVSDYRQAVGNFKAEAKAYNDFGLCCVLKFEPAIIGNPGRIALMNDVLDYVCNIDTWIATGEQIALFVREDRKKDYSE